MYSALAPLVGALITLMNDINSRFADVAGNLVATLFIHLSGLTAVSLLLLLKREPARPGRLPLYLYLGGFVGVGTVFASNYAFSALGASLSVALALLGQTLFSIAADAVGLFGRKQYPYSARQLPGIALAVGGVAVMAGSWRADLPAMLVAFAAGVLPGLSIILNSELGRKKGMLRSTRMNYVVGLSTTLVILLIFHPPAVASARAVVAAGPLLVLSGGMIGVAVVAALNFIIARIPAFSATLLIFSGEAFAGVLIDALTLGRVDLRRVAGTLLLLAGLALNALLSRRGAAEGRPR